MDAARRVKISKRLSWALRHEPDALNLHMDAAGWVETQAVLSALGLDRGELEAIAALDPKARMQFEGERMRACQGHSRERTPVTLEALEASWTQVEPENCGLAFHGTSMQAWRSIASEGIHAAARSHVHLAPDEDSVVGKRAGVELLLEIDPSMLAGAGYPIFLAPNGVLLTRAVPAHCIVALRPQTKAARRAHECGALELPPPRGA